MTKATKYFRFLVCIFVILLYIPCAYAWLYNLHPNNKNILPDGKMHIVLCGTGDPEPAMQALRKPSCLAVIVDNQFLLFDAGEGSVQTLASMGLPIQNLDNVFMTHWHSDHIGGLGQIINERWLHGGDKAINVYGPKGVKQVISGISEAYQLDAEYRVKNRRGFLKYKYAFAKPHVIKATNKGTLLYKGKNIEVYAFLVDHYPAAPAVGYRIQYKNCKIVISGDTKVTSSLAQNSKDADVLISEAFSDALYKSTSKILQEKDSIIDKQELRYIQGSKHYHSDTIDLAKMAAKSHVKNLFLTHLVPAIGVADSYKKAFIAGMSQYYKGPIIVTDDRDSIVVADNTHNGCTVVYKPQPEPKGKLYKNPLGLRP